MADLRALLAGALGVGLGIALVAYPGLALRVHTAGRLPSGRGGEYGDDAPVSGRTRRFIQAAGVVSILAGGYFAAIALGI